MTQRSQPGTKEVGTIKDKCENTNARVRITRSLRIIVILLSAYFIFFSYSCSYITKALLTGNDVSAYEPRGPLECAVADPLTFNRADSVSVEIKNAGKSSFEYGVYYDLEVLQGSAWYKVKRLPWSNQNWPALANVISAGETIIETYSLTDYGRLPPGQYRLIISDGVGIAEFQIQS